ncbi:hypothetical protein AVEN_20590-1 [Araneus ventricosus]|uniref:Uncharacterized protein n=1 Tax=Araneus ventricosus TaxID=182803 RepID=A0A4Y2EI98_ARAVE|nr:hypothetical protein AVEN_20590-1 [Araneus ventricosus]
MAIFEALTLSGELTQNEEEKMVQKPDVHIYKVTTLFCGAPMGYYISPSDTASQTIKTAVKEICFKGFFMQLENHPSWYDGCKLPLHSRDLTCLNRYICERNV